MIVGIPKETFPGERRVALTPAVLPQLSKAGIEVLLEAGAGAAAGYPDALYTEKGARIAGTREEVFKTAEIIVQVRGYGANPDAGKSDLPLLRQGQTMVAMLEPLAEPELSKELSERGVTVFAMEMIPRITRAQSMDVLSSMATIAGYKAVLLAADALPKMFPMMMTAAGTISPARVFIIGAGVAGLQAIASAKRMGAVVHAYDVRPAVKEQVQSLGGKFVEIELDTSKTEDGGGYAKAMDEEAIRKQRELMTRVIAESDIVITTAAVPGKKAPVLVTREMVEGMKPGSVIVDLASEKGGNCELTESGQTVEHNGITIIGQANLPATIPFHGSQMYGKNVTTFLLHLVKEGQLIVDLEDEITSGTLVAKDGAVVHPMVRKALGLESDPTPERSNA